MDCFRISVIVPCHNYGHYLAQCLTSILEQTRIPDEIFVVDDNSQDNTEEVALQFADKGVRYIRAEFNDPLAARQLGVRVSSGEILCFIDADDFIDSTYIESGIKHFTQHDTIGIVYSDLEYCGWLTGRQATPPDTSSQDIHQANFIHAGSLVRRCALEIANSFNQTGPSHRHEDWIMWRRIIDAGFTGVRQSGIYFYRKHDHNLSSQRIDGENGYSYYTGASLSSEEVTFFTTLSGRLDAWEQLRTFLERQSWRHSQMRLIFFDCSDSASFSQVIRQWLASCDYQHIHYAALPDFKGGWTPAGATWDADRSLMRDKWLRNCQIISALQKTVQTHYLWMVEEDILPPLDACEQLLQSFSIDTVSVTAACPHTEGTVCAWDTPDHFLGADSLSNIIEGNSFSCVILRSSILCYALLSDFNRNRPVEALIYGNLPPHSVTQIHWGVRCERPLPPSASPSTSPITRDTFDEDFYLDCYRDVALAVYSGHFGSAYDHYLLHGISEGRLARIKPLPDLEKSNSTQEPS
jgi:glycosyltransferase involved in cell wall biosynthesis